MSIPYYHVDSFADELFAGNPAGICLVPAFPADVMMQKIAAENRHSETAFVVARTDGDFDLRWFTPEGEDDLCGHATLASAFVLSLRGHDQWPVRFHTKGGLLTVIHDSEEHAGQSRNQDSKQFEMDFPARPAVSCDPPAGLLAALGLQQAEVLRCSRDVLVVVDRAQTVQNLKPNFAALAKIDMGPGGGAIVSAPGENGVDYVCRFFLPSMGINEDPVTGSIHCTLAPYWADRTGKQTFLSQQLSSRGGKIRSTLAGDRVKISGKARLYLQGTIHL